MRSNILVTFFISVICSCSNNDTQKKNESVHHQVLTYEGLDIVYTDTQKADITLLFIHGWGINQTYWQDQILHFSKKYRIVTLDLPGFGQSGKNRNAWTIENYGRDITALMDSLDLRNVILIGHSMSGAVVVEAALLNASRVLGIVGVDNFKDIGVMLTPELAAEWAVFYDSARKNYKQIITETFSQYFFAPGTDDGVRNRVLKDIGNADSTYVIDILQYADQYPIAEKLKQLNRPIHLINSDFAATDTLALQQQGIAYHLWNMGTTGHYPMIENPARFNLLLEDAIKNMTNRNKD